ncbi:short-chain dehydrogenase [Rhodovulum sulfidophilum]|uniref:SDR family NAD(P)-dependent oxidoreductase n=1 Tax=Rhodovulum visakhapatnamense TaxID=364297 RepID=A0ABS1REF7_9RHOB|nr:SDR family NAD(P)-dependent oxidoreductase [Rhodovulum visakhapatnamense]MBL3577894.1 SDR family NAD(P)-dependent oxidoreductase [Rhodovulum visakhapatnamense]OLS43700.1 short-chain dehydrogenase [Rhodovulum sulfidophilum]
MTGRALVTGGAPGVVVALAVHLAREGHDVALHCAGDPEAAARTVAEIRALGRVAVALDADLLDEAAASALVPRAAEALGGPMTVLTTAASVFEHDTFSTATRQSWDRHIGANLRAPFVLMQTFAAQAPEAGRDAAGEALSEGLVVNVIDRQVLGPTPDFLTYTLAETGLWALTRTAAQALAPAIRVNAIAVGEALRGTRCADAPYAAFRASTTPVTGRGSEPKGLAGCGDAAAALGYLLAAKAVTGQVICVGDGHFSG